MPPIQSLQTDPQHPDGVGQPSPRSNHSQHHRARAIPVTVSTRKSSVFERLAAWTTRITGGRWGFVFALAMVVAWLVTGPLFRFSELWQLVINTITNIVTFLMVFLIQNAQNRESKALQLKMDELIFSAKPADNAMINIETLTDEQLDQLAERYRKLAETHHRMEHARVAKQHRAEVECGLPESDAPLSGALDEALGTA